MWASEFENNPSLGLVEEMYTGMKAKGWYLTPALPFAYAQKVINLTFLMKHLL